MKKMLKIALFICTLAIVLSSCGAKEQSNVSTNEQTTTAITTTVQTAEQTTTTTTAQPVETATETTAVTVAQTEPEQLWTETANKATMYVTCECYSRKNAVIGAEQVEYYKYGTKVNITAKTDTGYYKLSDGSYIHSDYLGNTKPFETTTTKPKPVGTTVTTTAETVETTAIETESETTTKSPKGYISSGYKKLDDIMFPVLDKIIKKNMNDRQKLLACYDYLLSKQYAYRTLLIPASNKKYSEQIYAIQILKEGYGVCYDFSSAYKFMTRALGFKSNTIYGFHTSPYGGGEEHVWVTIVFDGTEYIFDPAIDRTLENDGYSDYHQRFYKTYSQIGRFYKNY